MNVRKLAFAVGMVALAARVQAVEEAGPLAPPPSGPIPVAFLLSDGATMIDFAGPWEVFQDVLVPGRGDSLSAFRLYTVAETEAPIRASGGMKIVPDYTLANAPVPKVVVVPAQSPSSEAVRRWLQKSAASADVILSVCAGSFVLAEAGLLDGLTATTHHAFYGELEGEHPKVSVQRGRRFVEHARIATAGGLTSGIDLALRVVERYFGRPTVERTVYYMEYQSEGWRDATGGANARYATGTPPPGTATCPVCRMEVPEGHLTLQHDGRTYHFCSTTCRDRFRAEPAKYLASPD
jgi:putative intracellular protease/amidase/YHS domain-containing protein